MSRANVEMVKRALDAYNRHDLAMYDDLCTPDFEWFPALMGIVDSESFRGREALARYYEVVSDTWEEFRAAGEEFRDLGERVLARMRVEGRGKGSHVPVVGHHALIFDFRDGRISRVRTYLDHGQALRAPGLEE